MSAKNFLRFIASSFKGIGKSTGKANMTARDSTMREYLCPTDSACKVVVDITDDVAYGYFVLSGDIRGDVWLWNEGEPPQVPEWHEPGARPPFMNPTSIGLNNSANPSIEDICVYWHPSRRGYIVLAVGQSPFAALWPGCRPGWNASAIVDSSVALKDRPDWVDQCL
jgi:hypothetical protein